MTEQEVLDCITNYGLIEKAARWAVFDKMPVGVDHLTRIILVGKDCIFCEIRYLDDVDKKTKSMDTVVNAKEISEAMAKHYDEGVNLWHREQEVTDV